MCIGGDNEGQIVSYNPLTNQVTKAPAHVDGSLFLLGISCPATNECAAVDQYGNIAAGDPANPAGWTVTPIGGETTIDGVSCPSTSLCVAVDITSSVTVGTGPSIASGGGGSSGVPVSSALPTIAGADVVGDTLNESHGTWSNAPTGYVYQWERCNAAANGCKPIAGATAQTYELSSGDVNSTIRVTETAANAAGNGAPAVSAPTATITASAGHARPTAKVLTARINSHKRTATFHLGSSGKATGFRCALVREPTRKGAKAPKIRYAKCGRVKTYRHLKPGHFKFYVLAVGAGGTSKKPATYTFKLT